MPLILSTFFQQMNLNWDWFKLTLNDKYLRTYWGLIMASTILSDYVLCWRFDTKKIKNYEAWKLTLFYNPTWWHHKKKVTAHMYFFIHLQIGLTTKFVKNQFSYTLQWICSFKIQLNYECRKYYSSVSWWNLLYSCYIMLD